MGRTGVWQTDQQAKEAENYIWQRGLLKCMVIGLATGLAVSFFSQSVFYETALYYGKADWMQEQYTDSVSEMLLSGIFFGKNIHYFAYFLTIRLLIPGIFLLAGMFLKSRFFLKGYLILQIISLSVQSALIFGALGMEGWFSWLFRLLIPESLYFLASIRVYQFKKLEIPAVKQYLFCILQVLFLMLAGGGLEISITVMDWLR